MRRVVFGAGTVVLSLATFMLAIAPISAQRGGHGAGGHGGGGHSVVHVGSVHYGARVTPAPAVSVGTVRSEHYAGSTSTGAYRNPYRNEYFRHFRPGYRPFVFGDAQYYGYDSLPLGYEQVVLNGITYYLFEGVYYQAYIYGGQTVYVVVPPPA